MHKNRRLQLGRLWELFFKRGNRVQRLVGVPELSVKNSETVKSTFPHFGFALLPEVFKQNNGLPESADLLKTAGLPHPKSTRCTWRLFDSIQRLLAFVKHRLQPVVQRNQLHNPAWISFSDGHVRIDLFRDDHEPGAAGRKQLVALPDQSIRLQRVPIFLGLKKRVSKLEGQCVELEWIFDQVRPAVQARKNLPRAIAVSARNLRRRYEHRCIREGSGLQPLLKHRLKKRHRLIGFPRLLEQTGAHQQHLLVLASCRDRLERRGRPCLVTQSELALRNRHLRIADLGSIRVQFFVGFKLGLRFFVFLQVVVRSGDRKMHALKARSGCAQCQHLIETLDSLLKVTPCKSPHRGGVNLVELFLGRLRSLREAIGAAKAVNAYQKHRRKTPRFQKRGAEDGWMIPGFSHELTIPSPCL